MGDGSKLIKVMREAAKPTENERVGISIGEVIPITPIKIRCDKLELTEAFLLLSPFCRELTLNVFQHHHTITTTVQNAGAHTHGIPAGTTGATVVGDHGTHTHTIPAAVTESGGDHGHTASSSETDALTSVTVWRGLQVGDKVQMLKCAGGQTYYVLERIE